MIDITIPFSTHTQRIQILEAIQYHTDYKRYLAKTITDGRTDSLSQLYYDEADALIKKLIQEESMHRLPRFLQFDLRIKRHRHIMSLCLQFGWTKEDDRLGTIVNMHALFCWLMSDQSPVNKCLVDLKDQDLNQVIEALERLS